MVDLFSIYIVVNILLQILQFRSFKTELTDFREKMVKHFPLQLPLKSNTVSITAETFFESLKIYHTSGSMGKKSRFPDNSNYFPFIYSFNNYFSCCCCMVGIYQALEIQKLNVINIASILIELDSGFLTVIQIYIFHISLVN